MTLFGLLLLAAVIMKVWPALPFACWLREILIDRPLALLSRIERRHVIFLIVGLAVMYSFAEMGAPHLALGAAIDMSAYVDVLITAWTVAALTRTRGSWVALRSRFLRPASANRPRPRARRSRPAVRPDTSNDDDDHAVIALAA